MSTSHKPMKKASRWPRFLPWLAGAAGLLGGVFYSKTGEADTGATRSVGHAERKAQAPGKATAVSGPGVTSLFLRKVATASAEECKELVQYHSKLPDQDIELEAIFRRLLSLEDPNKIWDELSGSPRWGRAFFNAWVSLDEAAAMDAAKHPHFSSLRAAHAIRSGHSDFAERLKASELDLNDPHGGASSLRSLGQHHPEVAKSLTSADLPPERKSTAIALVAEGMATRDPKAAWDWVRSIRDPDLVKRAMTSVLSQWMKSDPQSARAAWESVGRPDTASKFFASALGTLSAPEVPSHHHLLAMQRDPFLSVETLYQSLMDSGIDWTKPQDRTVDLGQDWREEDPAAAVQSVLQLPPGAARDYMLSSICRAWEKLDPEEAEKFAVSHGIELSSSKSRKEEPTPAMRDAAIADPQGTFAALFDPEALKASGANFTQVYQLANQWVSRSPDVAVKWLVDQPYTERSHSLEELRASSLFTSSCYEWGEHDPFAAIEWLESLPNGIQKTKGWGSMRLGVATYDPALAFELSTTHATGEDRLEMLKEDLGKAVEGMDSSEVPALLESSGLSSEEKDALTEELRKLSSKQRE